MMNYFIIVAFSFLAWLLASVNIALIKPLKTPQRYLVHYVMEAIIFGGVFALYFWQFEAAFGIWQAILIVLFSLLAFEMLAWKLYYKQVPWYYGFWHWWFPTYIIAAAMYGAASFS